MAKAKATSSKKATDLGKKSDTRRKTDAQKKSDNVKAAPKRPSANGKKRPAGLAGFAISSLRKWSSASLHAGTLCTGLLIVP